MPDKAIASFIVVLLLFTAAFAYIGSVTTIGETRVQAAAQAGLPNPTMTPSPSPGESPTPWPSPSTSPSPSPTMQP